MSADRSRLSVATGREADLFSPLKKGRVQCTACARRCQVGEGQVGLCGVRGVVGGKLYLLNYGRIIAGHVRPHREETRNPLQARVEDLLNCDDWLFVALPLLSEL